MCVCVSPLASLRCHVVMRVWAAVGERELRIKPEQTNRQGEAVRVCD